MIQGLSTAISGLFSTSQRVNESANNIANSNNDGFNDTLTQDIIELSAAASEFKANTIVVKTLDELSETLINSFDERV